MLWKGMELSHDRKLKQKSYRKETLMRNGRSLFMTEHAICPKSDL